MRFDLMPVTRNALLNVGNSDAAYRQTEAQHDEALNHFIEPGMSPQELMGAMIAGEDAEQKLPQYWDDATPRLPLNAGSSWINSIEVQPSLGLTIFTLGGKQYYKPMTPDEAGDMVTSNSIGDYYNNFLRGR